MSLADAIKTGKRFINPDMLTYLHVEDDMIVFEKYKSGQNGDDNIYYVFANDITRTDWEIEP